MSALWVRAAVKNQHGKNVNVWMNHIQTWSKSIKAVVEDKEAF